MDELLSGLNKNAPASTASIVDLERQLGVQLPLAYTQFLARTNGGAGPIGPVSYVDLWTVGEIISLNRGYEVQAYAPDLLVFGSDGGGEAFGFDTRTSDWTVVQVPFLGMSWDLAVPMGATFDEFLEALYCAKGE